MRKRIFAVVIVPACVLAIPSSPLAAQGLNQAIQNEETEAAGDQVTAEEAMQRSQVVYGPPPPRRSCQQDQENSEIVVCAEEQEDQAEFRVQSTAELDPEGAAALDDGIPRAPDFNPPPCVPNLLTACSKFGGAARPPVVFDISELPEAPEGSDADKISKGQMRAD